MAKILLICANYLYPTSTSGQIARTCFEELVSRGHTVTVLALDRSAVMDYNHPGIEARVLHDIGCNIYFTYLFKRCLRDLSYSMDSDYWLYRRHVLKEGSALLKQGDYDIIHSICIPYSCHMVAKELHEKYNIPWVAQFYDPWTENFYREFKTEKYKRKNALNEESVARSADFIIHSNKAIKNLWMAKYGKGIADKITIIPFNLGRVPDIERGVVHKGDKLTISHIGNFYGARNPNKFIQALESLLSGNESLRKKIQVNFIGDVPMSSRTLIESKRLTDIVTMTGKISEAECNKYYTESDVFLSIDAPTDGPNVFYPSKIIKYFYFDKPIMGITPKDSPSDIAFKEAGHISIDTEDIDGMVGYLKTAIADYGSLNRYNHEYWKNFTTEHINDIYEEQILSKI